VHLADASWSRKHVPSLPTRSARHQARAEQPSSRDRLTPTLQGHSGPIEDPAPDSAIADPARGDAVADPARGEAVADPAPDSAIADPGPVGAVADPGPDGAIVDPGPDGAIVDPGPDGAIVDPGPDGAIGDPGPNGAVADTAGMQATGPVWVDTDGGSDDALALLYLAAAGVPIVGVSAVDGVTERRQAAANAAGVLARVGLHPPVHLGRERMPPSGADRSHATSGEHGGSPTTPRESAASRTVPTDTGTSPTTPREPAASRTVPTDTGTSPTTPREPAASRTVPTDTGTSPTTPREPAASRTVPTDTGTSPTTPREPAASRATEAGDGGPSTMLRDVRARHGRDGLGGAGLGDPTLIAEGDAVERLLEAARRTPGLRVLAIGPMTNLATALAVEPDLSSRLGTVVCVAGGAAGVRDTNTWIDPDAMRLVLDAFREQGNLAVVTSTSTFAAPIEGEPLRRLRTSRVADGIAWRVVAGYQARQSAEADRQLLVAHDALAATLLVDRELATVEVHAGGRVDDGRAFPDGDGRIRWVTSLGPAATRVVEALAPGT
jgi:inosine-uridine nucleoside N-ribohydrolase